jgi:hypothetical protein
MFFLLTSALTIAAPDSMERVGIPAIALRFAAELVKSTKNQKDSLGKVTL